MPARGETLLPDVGSGAASRGGGTPIVYAPFPAHPNRHRTMRSALDTVFLVLILPLAFAYLFAAIGVIALVLRRTGRSGPSNGDREVFPAGLGRMPSQPSA